MVRAALGNVHLAARLFPVNSLEARVPSIPRALAMQAPAAPEPPAHGPVLALGQDSERPAPASAHAPAPVAHRRPLAKLRVRSAPPHAAEAEDSNSTQRPKKAR